MTPDCSPQRFLPEIDAYEDDELIERTWFEFGELRASEAALRNLEEDLREATRELGWQILLSSRARGRVRRILLNCRIQACRRGRR